MNRQLTLPTSLLEPASDPGNAQLLDPTDSFVHRHIGPRPADIAYMLERIEASDVEQLIHETIPDNIRINQPLNLPPPRSESTVLAEMRDIAAKNKVFRSFIGMGYYGTLVPTVIQRNVLENPGWYTQYTPYQAEIAQGRLEALLNFQTMVSDLTGMEIANASMLDEGTAAAEAMTMCHRLRPRQSKANTFFVSERCHPQTIAVVQTRADPLDIEVVVGDHATFEFSEDVFGALLQYPATDGDVLDYGDFVEAAHNHDAFVTVAADLLALTLLRPPGEFGADVVVGNSQRFGVPYGFGGPHAAYMATREEFQRQLPGRLVGVSKDADGNIAMRLALQTREQHIRRDRATSNICTAQVLLAIMASMYAVYHGPEGLTRIARRVQLLTRLLAEALEAADYETNSAAVFDTVTLSGGPRTQREIQEAALARQINLRYFEDGRTGFSLDETTTVEDLHHLMDVLGAEAPADFAARAAEIDLDYGSLARQSDFLTHPIFNSCRSETEMLRYISRLQSRDLSLAYSMIPLGSCTMKLNATSEMLPVTWPEFGNIHPFAPGEQTEGYQILFQRLGDALAEITGFAAISFMPNAGSQGEYAGLLTIRAYHRANGDEQRDICLIPSSAHGTNPASAVMAGMDVQVVKTDENGNIDFDDLVAKAEKAGDRLAALMVTYPSTHGVFERNIRDICQAIHDNGGQVYLDGANMNAQVGLCRPGDYGADVCHLNLHKTFCIPHGGGGPGMGPIGVAEHLLPFLPGHPVVPGVGGEQSLGTVSSAPWGSPSILPISYAYIAMMGGEGLRQASIIAVLNANYMAHRLEPYFPVLYKGFDGRVAHECIIDLRDLKAYASVDDVAKRLMDYGFHAPTMSFPVVGTLMIEPTESESLEELDRFCDAMIAIREEIRMVEDGEIDPVNNPLAHAPHTAQAVLSDAWDRPYSRERGAFPVEWVRHNKFWPPVARIDNVYGDRNLFCICPPMDAYEEGIEALG